MGEGDDSNHKVTYTKQDQDDMEKLKFSDDLGNGPIQKRWCTDIFFCMFFTIFVIALGGCWFYGFTKGNPELLTIGWDNEQNGCGHSDATKDYPYLYWPQSPSTEIIEEIQDGDFIAATKILKYGACVKSCPTADTDAPIDCYMTPTMEADRKIKDCEYYPAGALSPSFRYSTTQIGGFCMPDAADENSAEAIEALRKAFTESEYGQASATYFFDILICWPLLVAGSLIALALGYLYLFVIRIIGGAIIWVTLIIAELSLILGGLYSFYYRSQEGYLPEEPQYQYLAWAAYVLWAIAFIILIAMCCCYSAIKLGIAVFKATSKFVQDNMRIFVLPGLSYLVVTIWALIWFVGALFVWTVGDATPRVGYEFVTEIMWFDETRYVLVYYIFALFWINAFLIGCTQFIIGCAACIWYFDQGTDKKQDCVMTGFKWLFRYHLGSIAFGSFCIAVCQIIRVLFEYYRRKIGSAVETKFIKTLKCLTGYLLYIMEKCVKYITKNGYIQIALTNEGFCKSSWNAFTLMIKHAPRFGLGNSIGFIFIIFGCAAIAALDGFGCYVFLTQTDMFPVVEPVAPCVAVGVISVMIAWIFLSIFGFSSDAIFLSFLLDEELRFSGKNRPVEFADFEEDFKARGKGSCECQCF